MTPFQSIYFDETPINGRIVDIFEAQKPSQKVALFFVHGGGWRAGSRTIFHSIIHEYRKLGFDCASTDYRLGGTTVFDQVGDVRTGLDIFAENLAARNRPTKVLLLGSSAGAHLALLTGLSNPEECGAPQTPLRHHLQIAGIAVQAAPFTFEPWPDIFPAIWSNMESAVGKSYEDAKVLFQQASPIHYVRTGSPPVFNQHAENEHMFPQELYLQFEQKMIECGNVCRQKMYPKTEHGFFYALDRWQQREAFEDIRQFAEESASAIG
jgi:acetyl esterase/lipase